MNRKYNNRYTISINVERSVYDAVISLLPRGVYISDEINEFLKQRRHDLEIEHKKSEPDKSPIKVFQNENVCQNSVLQQVTKPTLNIFGTKQDLVTYVQNIPDSKTAWTVKRNAQLVCDMANTRAKDLQSRNK